MGRVYAVASGKGGVGKTTTTVNLGAALAAAGHDVAVVDADLGMANLAGAFGVDPAGATIYDALAGEADVKDATYEGAGGVSVVPGSGDVAAFARSDPTGLDDVLDALSGYDFVLLDTGASLTHVNVRPLAIADEVLLVSTTERTALDDTDRTREVTNRVGGRVAGAVLTRVDPANPNAEEVAATLDATVLEVVPEDPAVGEAMAAGEPLAVRAPDSQAAAAYRRLAALLSGDAGDVGDVGDAEDERAEGVGTGADGVGAAGAGDDEEADENADEGDDAAVEDAQMDDTTDRDAPDEADAAAEEGASGTAAGEEDAPEADEGATVADDDGDDDPVPADETAADAATADTPDAGEGESAAVGESDAEDESDGESDAVDAASDADDSEADEADEADEEDDEGTVSETVLAGESGGGLVEEAEPGDAPPDADAEGDAPPSGGFDGVPDAESGTNGDGHGDDEDEDDDKDGKGFFRRLLG